MLKGAIKLIMIKVFYSNFFFIDKLHTHTMGLEPTTLPSTLLLQAEEVAFELKLRAIFDSDTCIEITSIFLDEIILD